MEFKNLKKELARDFLALGSWVFFILVIARALIKPYRPFGDQMIIAGIILLLINLIIKDSDGYISRGIILVVFTILFYGDKLFTVFAILVLIGLLVSSYLVGNSKLKIGKGIILGVIVSWASYYLANFSLNLI